MITPLLMMLIFASVALLVSFSVTEEVEGYSRFFCRDSHIRPRIGANFREFLKDLPILESRRIINTRVDGTRYEDACDRIENWVKQNYSCYIVAANVHVVMMGYWHSFYQKILNQAVLVTPDGMPLVIGLRLLGIKHQQRVYGPDLMLAWCQRSAQQKIPIFLYGGTPEMLDKLANNLTQKFPQLIIAGCLAPPFRALSLEEEAQYREQIRQSRAKVVFVGLGCPKQEEWMARQMNLLPCVMIGVGAAFSFHSGMVSQAPRWMMKRGLEWLYRLFLEPKRLWKRYLINNPCFLVLFTFQLLTQLCFKPNRG